jgi:hypothetical protein
MSNYQSQSRFRREELRGLFALGLLAVVASIRIQSSKIMFTFGGISVNVTDFLDVVLITWSIYAFFMVLGLSTDIIGKKASEYFLKISTQYLYLSFVFVGLFSVIYFNELFPQRAIWILAYGGITIGYFLIKWAWSFSKKTRQLHRPSMSELTLFKKKLLPKLGKFLHSMLGGFFVSTFLFILFGVYEELVFPFFIFGSICLLVFLIYRDLTKEDETLDY